MAICQGSLSERFVPFGRTTEDNIDKLEERHYQGRGKRGG